MSLEIERKFLVEGDWPAPDTAGKKIIQGYLPYPEPDEVRVRIAQEPDGTEKAWLTRKQGQGLVRTEEEVEISLHSARGMLELTQGVVLEKVRYELPLPGGLTLEVDVYEGGLAGLVVAEVELPSADHQAQLPDWLGLEVTEDKAYKNKSLATKGRPLAHLRRPKMS